MTAGFHATDRAVLRIAGADHRRFLQDLVTNDLDRLAQGPVYTALLTPQGKYLFDFLMIADGDGDGVLVDVAADRAAALAQRLTMYRLRAKVTIDPTNVSVILGTGSAPQGALADPRDPGLGWRIYTPDPAPVLAGMATWGAGAYTALRVALGVPQTGVELIADQSYILEAGFDRLKGVDFRKGCYVGQEVTARMRHKTALRKGLVQVRISGPAPAPGADITVGDKTVGTLYSVAGDQGLAYLRFDRAGPLMRAGEAQVIWNGAGNPG